MKAFLLAAGEGRRLRPLTAEIPKCLVPIRGVPLLAIWLLLLERHGVTDVLINLHYHADKVRAFLDTHPTTVHVETVFEPELLGSAGTVAANRGFVQGERAFLIAYADNLTNVDLDRLVRVHEERNPVLTMGVVPTDRPSEKGVVRLGPRGEVLQFVEKSPTPPSNLSNAGIYVAGPETFDYFPAARPAEGVLDFGFHVLPKMTPRMCAVRIEEFLMDIGTPDAYARAQDVWPGL